MTRERAAEICQYIKFILKNEDYTEEVEEALDVAIEALEQEPSCRNTRQVDPISRQAAIEAMKKEAQVDGAYDYIDIKTIVDLLNDLPSAEQESIKFYYVESLDDYWVGRRLDNFYYATWHERFGFIWSHSKYLPWGEHVVDENTLWKEHTYPSEPKEIPFTEWIIGFTKKYFQQEPIINCKSCKHWHEWDNGTGSCHRSDTMWVGSDYDDYCSFAERMESDEE